MMLYRWNCRFLYFIIKTGMKIANEQTFRQFDKMKQQIFHKKQTERKTHLNINSPLDPKLKWLVPSALIIGGLALAYMNMPNLRDVLLKNGYITHQQIIAWDVLKCDIKCRWEQVKMNPNQNITNLFANDIYITKLEADYLYLTQKKAEKNLQLETKTKFSWWILNFGNQEKIYLINQYGDLVQRTRKSKFMLGSSFRIWKKSQDRIIERDRLFNHYLNERENIGKECSKINYLTRFLQGQKKYEQSLNDCKTRAKLTGSKIEKFLNSRLNEDKSTKIKI